MDDLPPKYHLNYLRKQNYFDYILVVYSAKNVKT